MDDYTLSIDNIDYSAISNDKLFTDARFSTPSTHHTVVIPPSLVPTAADPDGTSAKRGRPRKERYVCNWCGRTTIRRKDHCCEHCKRAECPAGVMPADVKSQYGAWLKAHEWTHSGTGTFHPSWNMNWDNEAKRESILNYIRKYFLALAKQQPDIAYMAVIEPNASNECHIHFVCNSPKLTQAFIAGKWQQMYKGFGHATGYGPGASIYTAKTLDNGVGMVEIGNPQNWVSLQ